MNEDTKETNENEPKMTTNSEKTVSAPEEGSGAAEAETSGPLPASDGERPGEADGVPGKGKIARLPHKIREKLNRRLRDGENGTTLLGWLNKLPTTRKALRKEFQGEPIGKQNLSRWVQNGYQSWLRKQEAFEQVRQSLDEAEQFEEAGSKDLTERVAVWLSMRCALEAQKLGEAGTDTDLAALGRLCRGVSALRRGEHSARRLKLEEKRLDVSLGEGSETLEKMFWEWTERPDIREKLFPKPPTAEEQMREYKRILGMDPDREAPAEIYERKQREKRAAEIEKEMAELDRQEAELEQRKAEIERRKAEEAEKSEDRGPKAEGNPKSEARNPNSEKTEDPPAQGFGEGSGSEVHPPTHGSYGATRSPKPEVQSQEGREDEDEEGRREEGYELEGGGRVEESGPE